MKQAIFNVGFTGVVLFWLIVALSGCTVLGVEPLGNGLSGGSCGYNKK